MGEILKLREAIATTEELEVIADFAATGDLRVVCGRGGDEFRIVVRAPFAPDLLIASGPWPEGEPDPAWSDAIGTWIETVRATLAVAARRLPALTARGD